MAEKSVAPKIDSIPKLLVYYQTDLTDKHWEDFENAFFGLDPNKPKPERYKDASFDPEEFKYKLSALVYWLVFDPESCPAEIKAKIEEWSQKAMGDDAVKEQMSVLEQCMRDFLNIVHKKQDSPNIDLITNP